MRSSMYGLKPVPFNPAHMPNPTPFKPMIGLRHGPLNAPVRHTAACVSAIKSASDDAQASG